jgi:hypothetical protein
MEVIPKETSLSGQGNSAIAPPGFDVFTIGASGLEGQIALPRKRSSTIVTSMILESGQPVMIGGLATDTEIEQHTEVPFLADIPWLGELFQHDSKTAARRSLMVFITPTIVRTASDQQRLLERELRQRRSEFGDRLREILYGDEAAMAKGAKMGADPVEMTGESVLRSPSWRARPSSSALRRAEGGRPPFSRAGVCSRRCDWRAWAQPCRLARSADGPASRTADVRSRGRPTFPASHAAIRRTPDNRPRPSPAGRRPIRARRPARARPDRPRRLPRRVGEGRFPTRSSR